MLAFFGAHIGDANLVILGFVFISLHLIWEPAVAWFRSRPPG